MTESVNCASRSSHTAISMPLVLQFSERRCTIRLATRHLSSMRTCSPSHTTWSQAGSFAPLQPERLAFAGSSRWRGSCSSKPKHSKQPYRHPSAHARSRTTAFCRWRRSENRLQSSLVSAPRLAGFRFCRRSLLRRFEIFLKTASRPIRALCSRMAALKCKIFTPASPDSTESPRASDNTDTST